MRPLQRLVTILPVIAMLVSAPAVVAAPSGIIDPGCYLWTLSFSAADPFVSKAAPDTGVVDVYLWFMSTVMSGMTASQLSFTSTPGFDLVGFTPVNGFLNAGDSRDLLLAVGGCPYGPVVAGRFTIFDAGAGGSACMTPPGGNPGPLVTVDCDTVDPRQWPSSSWGCSSSGAAPCWIVASCSVAVEPTTWGSVKAQYR